MNTRRTRVGTNQYKAKYHKPVGLYLLLFVFLFDLMCLGYLQSRPSEGVKIISPVGKAHAQEVLITPTPTAPIVIENTVPEYNKADIEKYIKTIFGKDASIAIAVSHHECSPSNPKYPKCQLHTAHENSIGLFQINIESATTKVHWARIPNDTLEGKKEWLENPYNNTLLAYWIFQTSGWNPWSAYTSGRYLDEKGVK